MTIDNIANGETGVIVRTKLNLAIDKSNGIEPGATVNATDAALRDRATHTGTQAIGTVTDLQTTLDGKAASVHTHIIDNVTGLQIALDGKQPVGSYATAAQGSLADTATQPGNDAATLGSGAAIDGYVLAADGLGGAAWEEVSGGGGGSTDYVRTRSGTIQDIFDLADTWNDAAVTFNGIKLNVTDTASNAASSLLDLQVGGASRFMVRKNGEIKWGARIGLRSEGASLSVTDFGVTWITLRAGAIDQFSTGSYQIGSDTQLFRDAADTWAQRRTTNAQAFNVYNTFTNASNYERARMGWAGNVFEIKPEAGGTGTVRTLHISGLPTTDPEIDGVLWNDAGTVKASVV